MQYAVVNNRKEEASPGLKALCSCCSLPVYSACGKRNVWHWRHESKANCDPWWEPETEWHREWKSQFPESLREVVLFDSVSSEKHIADVKTMKGTVIEFQNSAISLDEVKSREQFYKKMVWVINANKFKNNIVFGHKFPDPKSGFPKNYKFVGLQHMNIYDKNEAPTEEFVLLLHEINGVRIYDLVDKFYTRHHVFEWKKPRKLWLETSVPTFLDFNDGVLLRIFRLPDLSKYPICAAYSKKDFLDHFNR